MTIRYTSLYVAILLMATIQFLETSMLGFASTPIRGEIQASPEEYSLITALYACFAVVSIAKVRWFVEVLGWRNYVLGSIAIYFLGGMFCSFSEDRVMFAVGRIVMALGGGAFMTIGRLLVNTLPGHLRFNGVSLFALGVLLGTMGGPCLAALVVSEDHWQAMFWILLGLSGVVALLTVFYAPKANFQKEASASNNLSFIFILALFSFFVLYLLQRSYYDFYNDGLILIVFLFLAISSMLVIFYVERRREKPLLRLREMFSKRFMAGIALFCVCYFLIGMNNYIQPQYLSSGLGYAWETIGYFQATALFFTLIIWMPIMRFLLPKYSSPVKYWLFAFGALMGYAWFFYSFSPEVDVWRHIVPALVLSGFFISAGMGTTAMQTFREFNDDEQLFAHAYQLKNMLGQIVQAIGTSVATIFMQWRQTVQYNNIATHFSAGDPIYNQVIGGAEKYLSLIYEGKQAIGIAVFQQSQSLSKQAVLLAGIEYYWVIFWLAIFIIMFTLAQRVFR